MSMHGRTRAGAYKAEVDYQAIARSARVCERFPLIAQSATLPSYEKSLTCKRDDRM